MRSIRLLIFAVVLLAAGATSLFAVEPTLYLLGPGTTEISFENLLVRVETTDDVIVQLSLVDGEVVGQVSPAPGTRSANVLIVLADDPERVIFEGRVVAPIWFADYMPQETGRGEQ